MQGGPRHGRRVRDGAPVRHAPPVVCAVARRPGRAAGSPARRGEYGVRTDERRNARPALDRPCRPEPAVGGVRPEPGALCRRRCPVARPRVGPGARVRREAGSWPIGSDWCSPPVSRAPTSRRSASWSSRDSATLTRRRCSARCCTCRSTSGCATASWPRRANPLALREWPRGLSRAELAGGFGMPASLSITGQIEESFRRRIAELPPATQRFLTVAAAEPTGDPVIVWRAASGLGVDSQDAAPAIDAGLVEIGVHVWFRHPLVRSAAYGSAALDGSTGCASGARRRHRSGSRARSARVASRARLARAGRRHRRGAGTIGRPRSRARWAGRGGGVARALGVGHAGPVPTG